MRKKIDEMLIYIVLACLLLLTLLSFHFLYTTVVALK